MNREGKYLVAAIGLLFLFMACEKDIAGGFGDGKKVEIFLSTNITSYHTGADVVRGAGLGEAESRTIYINDSIYLQTTLVPDAEEELRVPVGFENGQKICFEAYDVASSGTPVDSKIYSWSTSAGKFIPDTDPLGVDPDGATVYRFVAYSYFGETGVAPAASSIDPVHDLVWGKTATDQTITDTEVSRTVSISMTHQFARVKVVVKSGISTGDITALSGVAIDGGQLAGLTPFDGGISWSGTVTQGVDPFTVNSTTERESGYRTVKPVAAGSLKVKVGSVQISTTATIFTDQMVSFTPALAAATSYTLVVDVKRCVWARSNIYWDNAAQKLTFVTDISDLSKQGYQGVFFKWGSLVGISPAQVSGSNDFLSQDVPIYVPTYNSSTPASSTWEATTSTAKGWTTWGNYTDSGTDIPYLNQTDYAGSNYGRGNRYAIDDAQNTPTMYQGFRGDICQYLSKTGAVSGNYRLPTSNDFGSDSDWTTSGSSSRDNTLGNAEGTVDLLTTQNRVRIKNVAMGDVVFPASGFRGGINSYGGLDNVNSYGNFWSGSAPNAQNSHSLNFNSSNTNSDSAPMRSLAVAVRCVKNN